MIDLYAQLVEFHRRFGLVYDGPARMLPSHHADFRATCLREELKEYEDATTAEEKLDALVDLVYFALGTAYLHGFSRFNEAFARVHAANMQKVRSPSPFDHGERGSSFDVVKPPGWRPPVLSDLIGGENAAR